MLKPRLAVLALLLAASAAPDQGRAAALTVSPILLDTPAPTRSTVLTLRNREEHPVNVQVRVFAWTQQNGEDKLEPTEAVIASPPIVEVGGGAEYQVRLQQVAPGHAAEEAYRVVVDELPDLNRRRNGAISVLLRYSIPMFFADPDATQPHITWRMETAGTTRTLVAENAGDKRLQVSGLTIKAGTRSLNVAPGLAGYVLGHGAHRWSVPGNVPSSGVRIAAGSDHGPINAPLVP